MNKRDNIIPRGKWSFNEEVADCFNDMISRSIPDYNNMRDLTREIILQKVCDQEFNMLDIGCSTGIQISNILSQCGNNGHYIGIDTSKPMVERANKIFGHMNYVDIICDDFITNKDICNYNYDIITSSLTMQFIQKDVRQVAVNKVYDLLRLGGRFLMIEKIKGDTEYSDDLLVSIYRQHKINNGYTEQAIDSKNESLKGILVPNKDFENINMLKKAGFTVVDVYWRCLNFTAYIAIKN